MRRISTYDIIYRPSERVRQEVRDKKGQLPVESLAQSIKHFGQLVPIIVAPAEDGKYKLIDGERRLTAVKILGQTEINAVVQGEVSVDEQEAIEIITTLEREAFPWQEEVKAKRRLHELMCGLFGRSDNSMRIPGGWTIAQSARVLGESKANFARDLELAKALEEDTKLANRPNKYSAYKHVKRAAEFALREVLAAQAAVAGPTWEVLEGDCVEVMKGLEAESVDLVLTDPPFGILTENDMGFKEWRRSGLLYEDTPGEYATLMKGFLGEAFRVLKPGRHAYVFCSWEWIHPIKSWARAVGFETPGPPAIWYRRNRTKFTHMDRFGTDHYSVVFCAKAYPDQDTFRWQEMSKFAGSVILGIDPIYRDKDHPAEAPVELFRFFLELSSRPGELVLDAFCGSGACGEACLRTGRRFTGIDNNHDWTNLTRLRLSALEGK